jgi:hypothetical protein
VVTEPLTPTVKLVAAFLARTLPKPEWTHVAHLRVGLWHVRRFGEIGALTALRERIPAYNEAVGTANTDSSGYHETLTVFYVRLIADFLKRVGAAADGVLLARSSLLGRGAPGMGHARPEGAAEN